MKKLIIALLLMPALALAQDDSEIPTAPTLPKHEIGLQAGIFAELGNTETLSDIGGTSAISYLHNFKKVQLGVVLSAGYSVNNVLQLSPTIVCNNLVQNGTSYLYYGVAMGYYWANGIEHIYTAETRDGYLLGAQIGYLVQLSKRLSFSTEVAVRSIQVWYDKQKYIPTYHTFSETVYGHYTTVRAKDFYIKTPVTIGLRYRFL